MPWRDTATFELTDEKVISFIIRGVLHERHNLVNPSEVKRQVFVRRV